MADEVSGPVDQFRKLYDSVAFDDRHEFLQRIVEVAPEIAIVAAEAAAIEIEPVRLEAREPTEEELDRAQRFAEKVSETEKAKKYKVGSDDFLIFTAYIEGRPHLAVAYNDSNGRGVPIGDWNTIFREDWRQDLLVELDEEIIDTRHFMSEAVYEGLTEAAEAHGKTKPDGQQSAMSNEGNATHTVLTGEVFTEMSREDSDGLAPHARNATNKENQGIVYKRYTRQALIPNKGVGFRWAFIIADLSKSDNSLESPVGDP